MILAIIGVKQKVGTDEMADAIDDVMADVRGIKDEEQQCLNNMPDNLEGSERYDAMEAAVDNLEDAMDSLDDALKGVEDEESEEEISGYLDDAIRYLEKASV